MPEQDPLVQLRGLQLPDPVSAWPPAPGWWLLGLFVVVAIMCATYALTRHRRRNNYRRLALRQLKNLTAQPTNPELLVQQLNRLLKQTALSAGCYDHSAQLSGSAWLNFLDRTAKTQSFSQGCGQILAEGPYRIDLPAINDGELIKLVQNWIVKHDCSRGQIPTC